VLHMRIEVWSDVVCPWCYIGKRRLERALEVFEHADEVEVVYRSFELDPAAPKEATEPVAQVLARKYGGGLENALAMMARVSEAAAEEGLEYHLDRTLRGNTVDAHRLLHLAIEEHGPRAQAALKEALLAAYFTRVEDVADSEVLRKVATEAGLDPARVDQVLAGEEYAGAVREDVAQARAFGASGVPFFVVDRRYGVAGAQPVEVLLEVLEKAWADAHPSVAMVGSGGDVCGPDGCD
jgi:predicted DsbA family dithiol-disulfide isomerase